MKNLIFVDCEATGPCPGKGELTQFGAVDFASRQTFHGVLFESRPKLVGDFSNSQGWKRLRVTPHNHNPVDDAMGNVEAFARLLKGER
jgi:hypothetical protein